MTGRTKTRNNDDDMDGRTQIMMVPKMTGRTAARMMVVPKTWDEDHSEVPRGLTIWTAVQMMMALKRVGRDGRRLE